MQLPGRRFVKDEVLYSDWFPRGGDNMLLRAENIGVNGAGGLEIEVYTKNSDESGDGDSVEEASTLFKLTLASGDSMEQDILVSGATTTSTDPQGMKEMVRLKVTCTGTASTDWILARIFPPIFYDASQPA